MDFPTPEGITRAATDCTRKTKDNQPEAKPSTVQGQLEQSMGLLPAAQSHIRAGRVYSEKGRDMWARLSEVCQATKCH